jgi:hypothetical protein
MSNRIPKSKLYLLLMIVLEDILALDVYQQANLPFSILSLILPFSDVVVVVVVVADAVFE